MFRPEPDWMFFGFSTSIIHANPVFQVFWFLGLAALRSFVVYFNQLLGAAAPESWSNYFLAIFNHFCSF